MPIVLAVVFIDRACAAPAPTAAVTRGVDAAVAGRLPGGRQGPAVVYAPGACQSQAPTGRSRNRTVFIDAGHGGPDPGVTSGKTRESRSALAVATELARELRADGYRVILSRTGDTSVRRFSDDDLTDGAMSPLQVRQDLQARVRCANDAHASVLLSIHFNGYTDSSVGGSQTIYDDVRPFADRSHRLADELQAALIKQVKLQDRGVITDDELDAPTLSDHAETYGHLLLLGPAEPGWLDKGTEMPGALVEPLFLTAPGEAGLVTSASGQRRIAQALAAGLEAFVNG